MWLMSGFHGNFTFRSSLRCYIFFSWITFSISQTFGLKTEYDYKRRYPTPSFSSDSGNITFLVGSTANLSCVIENLGARTVIWRKLPDESPITIGETIYKKYDERLSISHDSSRNNWDLLIKDLKTEDTGVYECQVASSNKNIRQHLFLRVKDRPVEEKTEPPPVISIAGPEVKHVGEEVIINCSATFTGVAGIDWFFEGYLLESNIDEGIIIKERYSGITKTVHSTLTLKKASMKNKGKYTCRSADEYVKKFELTILSDVKTNNKKRGTESSTSGQQSNTSTRWKTHYPTVLIFLVTCIWIPNLQT